VNKTLLLILILMAIFGTGCNMELTSQIEDEILHIDQEIESLHRLEFQLSNIPEEIEILREQVVQKRGELKKFKKNHPDVVEFAIPQLNTGK